MRSGEDRKPDYLHIFLQGGVDDHFRGLSQTSINDFHARVAEGPRDDLGAAVVTVEPGLSHKHSYGRRHFQILGTAVIKKSCAAATCPSFALGQSSAE